MKPCAQCGAVCTDDSVFCTVCGASLTPLSPDGFTDPAAGAGQSPVSPQGTAPQAPVYPPQPPVPAAGAGQSPVSPQGAAPQAPVYSPQPPASPSPYGQAYPPTSGMPGYGQPPAYPGTPGYGQPPYPYGQIPRKRMAPTVLGIIGIVFGILLPLVTYCCSIPGLVMANQDIRRGLPNQAGRILNIIALAVALANSVFSIFYNSLWF